jgi:hypothetical protein
MRRATLLSAFALVLGVTPAAAQQTGVATSYSTDLTATGPLCSMAATTDVTREAGWQTGVITAGPLAITGYPNAVTDVFCTVQINNSHHPYYGGGVFQASASGQGTVVLPPTPVNFPATEADSISLCTEIWIYWAGHKTLWWSHANAPGQGYWSESWYVPCQPLAALALNDPVCSALLAVDQRLGTATSEVWQGCEPYEPII